MYNDAPIFGGHELMSVELAREIAKIHDVYYFFSNSKLGDLLEPPVKKFQLPFQSTIGFLAIKSNLNLRHALWLARQFRSIGADSVLVIQGSVDLCLRGTLAAMIDRIRAVSYIPMAFSRSEMALPSGFFFDNYFAMFYRMFSGFITINKVQKRCIHRYAGPDKPVHIIENCIGYADKIEKSIFRASHDILRIGFVGRLEGRQKGLEELLKIANMLKDQKKTEFRFVIIGGGDRPYFENLATLSGVYKHFEFRGWVADKNEIFRSFDILFMPSLFEGVPLVMLEALIRTVPVMARLTSGTRIFREYLPDFCLYTDIEEAVDKLRDAERFIKRFELQSDAIRKAVLRRHNRDRFAEHVPKIMELL